MKKIALLLFSALFIFGVVAGCSDSEESTGSGSDDGGDTESSGDGDTLDGEVVTILTGGTSGVYYPLGNAQAKIYNEELGAQASAQTTGASAENASKIAQQSAELAYAMADTVSDAYNGVGKFEDSGALENLRAVSALYTNYMQLVAPKDSGIESIEDLKGKKVAVGASGSGTEIMANRVLEAAGLSYDDIDEDYLSFKEGVEGIKNGTTDAAFLVSGLPNAGIMELTTTEDITLVSVSEEIVAALQEIYPAFLSEEIPGGTYDGVEEDVKTAAVKNLLITNAEMSDEKVYEMTKAFYENLDTLRDTHNAAEAIELEEATEGLPLPVHPGAEKYFKEQDVAE
jgi:TRAP transporter TAXI family solute receptor